jgi:ubiquinone/menaquinone biosynthesis C-methylase UbiE
MGEKFDKHSPGQDSHMPTFIVDTLFDRLEAAHVQIPNDAIIVDLGTRLGAVPRALRRRGFERVVGVDRATADDMQAAAHGEKGPDVVANIEQLPFADQSVDVVVASSLFSTQSYEQDQAAMLAEIVRVLKPGGFFLGAGNVIDVPVPQALELVGGNTGMYRKKGI